MKKVTWFLALHPVTFYGQNFEKQKWLVLVTCISMLRIPSNLGTGEREGKRTTIDWINRGKKHLKKIKMVSFGKIRKIEDTSFKFEYSDSC